MHVLCKLYEMFLNHVATAIMDYKRNRMQMISLLEYGLLPHYHYLEYTYYINIHHRNLEPEPINPHQSLRAVGTEDVVPSSWREKVALIVECSTSCLQRVCIYIN